MTFMIRATSGFKSRPARILAPCILGLAALASLRGAQVPTSPATKTFTYKRVGALEIKADVVPVAGIAGPRPVIVWIHGGALINGSRERDFRSEQGGWLWRLHEQHGVVLISIDYRLAPETPLPGIIEDIVDAFRWIREQGPALFHADPARVAVAGSSAGGYLTLMTGCRVQPRPVALVSLWGYGDLVGPWYTEPSPHARHHDLKPAAAEAWRQVSGTPIANAKDRTGNGQAFYQYCRQHGIWPWAVSGWNPFREAEKFHPFMPVKNVAADFSPTLLVHGQSDTDVPHAQSEMMAAEFKRRGVEHAFVSVPAAEHGLRGGDPQRIDQAFRAAGDFLLNHLLAGR
jgi:acetyl esterase/lipase